MVRQRGTNGKWIGSDGRSEVVRLTTLCNIRKQIGSWSGKRAGDGSRSRSRSRVNLDLEIFPKIFLS